MAARAYSLAHEGEHYQYLSTLDRCLRTEGRLGDEQSGNREVRYLSQKFVERLCSDDHIGTELVREIEAVVFSYVDPTETLNASSFDELRALRTEGIHEEGARLREDVARLIREECALRDNARKLREKKKPHQDPDAGTGGARPNKFHRRQTRREAPARGPAAQACCARPLAHRVAHGLPGGRGTDPLPSRLPPHRRAQPDPRQCPRPGALSSGSTIGGSAATTWSASTSSPTIPSTNGCRASGTCRPGAWCTSPTCTRPRS